MFNVTLGAQLSNVALIKKGLRPTVSRASSDVLALSNVALIKKGLRRQGVELGEITQRFQM